MKINSGIRIKHSFFIFSVSEGFLFSEYFYQVFLIDNISFFKMLYIYIILFCHSKCEFVSIKQYFNKEIEQ